MSIKWIQAEEDGEARVRRYPRIGGGTRRKDFGYVGTSFYLEGMFQGKDDLATARDLVRVRRERTFIIPWGGGVTERIRALVTRGRITPAGAGWFRIRIELDQVEVV